MSGCGVLSQPAACVPHICPGGSLCMRTPASPANSNHEALGRFFESSEFEQSVSARAGMPTLRQYSLRALPLDCGRSCGQAAWHCAAGSSTVLAAFCVGSISVGNGGGDGAKAMPPVEAGLQLSFTPSLNKLQPVSQPGRAGQSTSRASLPVQATKSIQ